MWMDVDTAVTVPVNVLALIDDTDFKSRETTVAYDAAGMDLVWNFVTTAGVQTQTAITPTTAGVYDWTNVGGAMYKIEIPASGGASANNDTEGFGWISGLVTGVLPWRGPIVEFGMPETNVTHWIGTACATPTVNGVPEVDVTHVAGSAEDIATGTICTEARLAELDAANLPTDVAAVKTDTGNLVTRITATLFSGITSLGEWLGAIAGKQASDATAQTEMRATGAGSGTYDATADSQESIRDRGDAAWTTGAGGSSPTVEDIRAEMDSNSTKLASILADTGTTIPATLSTLQSTATEILKWLKNKIIVTMSGGSGTLVLKDDDDSTTLYTQSITDANAEDGTVTRTRGV